MGKLSIIVPVYYNSDTLELMYEDLKEHALCHLPDYEIVMVDDGSGDNSWEVMSRLKEKDPHIKLIKLSRNFGSHAACLAGFLNCTGDCAAIKAADLQEPSELMLQLYESWEKGNKVVLAARSDREEGIIQKCWSNTYYWLMRTFALSSVPKGGFDCFLIDRQVIEVLRAMDEKNSAVTMQVLWVGFQRDIVHYVRKRREIGVSRWTFSKKFKLAVDSMMGFSYFPIRFISAVGIVFFLLAVIWALFVLFTRIFRGAEVLGWATLMIVQLFSSGTIMLTLGVLGEYIWRTLDSSRKRPTFIIDEQDTSKK